MSNDKVIQVTPLKSWWKGDTRVEPYMSKVNEAIERSGKKLTQDERTDIYNRAYEAVYKAIKDRDKIAGQL